MFNVFVDSVVLLKPSKNTVLYAHFYAIWQANSAQRPRQIQSF
jgi:uncharacterized membrane protein